MFAKKKNYLLRFNCIILFYDFSILCSKFRSVGGNSRIWGQMVDFNNSRPKETNYYWSLLSFHIARTFLGGKKITIYIKNISFLKPSANFILRNILYMRFLYHFFQLPSFLGPAAPSFHLGNMKKYPLYTFLVVLFSSPLNKGWTFTSQDDRMKKNLKIFMMSCVVLWGKMLDVGF